MRNFLRSIAGKTIVIIVLVLCLIVAAASIIGTVLILDYDFYSMTQEEALRDIHYREMHSVLDLYTMDTFLSNERNRPLSNDLIVMIYDENGELYSASVDTAGSSLTGYDEYTFYLGVLGPEGNYTDVYMTELKEYANAGKPFTLKAYATPHAYINESEALTAELVRFGYRMRYAVYPIGAAAVLLSVALFIILMCVAGRRPGSDELVPGLFFKVPFDLTLAFLACVFIALAALLSDAFYGDRDILIAYVFYGLVFAVVFVLNAMSFASRLKQHELVKHCVLYHVLVGLWKILCSIARGIRGAFRWIVNLIRCLPMVWHTVLIILGVVLVEFIVMIGCVEEYAMGAWVVFRLIEVLLLAAGILFGTVTMRKLQKAGEIIASGDLEHKVDTKGLYWDFKKHAENLNSISGAMGKAVNERMKSEHMKTELITNVSHDIKTPLTSIINYSSLIAGEKCDNPKIAEYSDVLLRQSEKLKRLIEDLVEVSKATTGNLEVQPVPCDASVFIAQSAGEYEEKLEDAGLSLVTSLPDREVRIMADSRRMWRVFDNLMNNICKYSQTGTRVYLSLMERAGYAVITFKNTSRDALNIDAEELMERFVRGDSSRNTDGNGLGLSIARSLTELQGGKFSVIIDGNLFKVTLTFPEI